MLACSATADKNRYYGDGENGLFVKGVVFLDDKTIGRDRVRKYATDFQRNVLKMKDKEFMNETVEIVVEWMQKRRHQILENLKSKYRATLTNGMSMFAVEQV